MAESYITIGAAGGLAPPGSRHYQSNDHSIRTAGGLALVGLCQVLLIHKADVIVSPPEYHAWISNIQGRIKTLQNCRPFH